jgi:hypothetical protein
MFVPVSARRWAPFYAPLLGAAVVTMVARVARAEAPVDHAYAAAIDAAVAAFEASDFRAARAGFERAHAIAPSARTFRGTGVSAFEQGDFVVAADSLRAALGDLRKPLSDEQRAEASDLLARAERNVGRVRIRGPSAASHAGVRVDGRAVTLNAESEVRLVSGSHVIRVDLKGRPGFERELAVIGGEVTEMELPAVALAGSPPPKSAPSPLPAEGPPTISHETAHGRRIWTWVALGAAPTFAGVGAALWFSGKADYDAIRRQCVSQGGCEPAVRDQRVADAGLSVKSTWATVAFVGAGAMLGTFVVLFVVEGRASEKTAPAFAVGLAGSRLAVRAVF